MFKKLLLGLFLAAAFATSVGAQTCPTRPVGDSSNACASTAFVSQALVVAKVLAPGHIFVGSAGSVATDVALSGDCTMATTGAITCTKLNSVSPGTIFPLNIGTGLASGAGNLNLQPAASGTIGGVQALTCSVGQAITAISTSGVPTCTAVSGGRILLTTATTFHVSTTGTDVAGCGLASGASACRTRGYLYSILSASYDLAGYTVTVQIADGTYTDSLQVYGPLLVGQAGAAGLIFQGNCASTEAVLIQPAAATGYAYSAAFGSGYRVQCQKLDMTSNRSNINTGADTVSIGNSSTILFGSLSKAAAGSGKDMTFGCNFTGYNSVTISFRGIVEFDNDFNIDPQSCQVSTTATTTSGSGTLTVVASTTNVVAGMHVSGTGIPSDAYVSSFTVNTIVMACIFTSPCQASASAGGVAIIIAGGGQSFMDMGNGAQGYFATNGQPDASIIVNIISTPLYHSGFFFINELSAINAQALTFTNPSNVAGRCVVVKSLSNVDTNLQGVPYLPCKSQSFEVAQSSVAVVAGDQNITVTSTTGITTGMIVNDVAVPTGTWSAGGSTIAVSSGTGICAGSKVTGAGILGGAQVASIVGTTVTLNPCGVAGPKCVSGFPTYLAGAGTQLYFTNCLFSGKSVVSSVVSGTVISIFPDSIKATGTAPNIWFQGQVTNYSIYD